MGPRRRSRAERSSLTSCVSAFEPVVLGSPRTRSSSRATATRSRLSRRRNPQVWIASLSPAMTIATLRLGYVNRAADWSPRCRRNRAHCRRPRITDYRVPIPRDRLLVTATVRSIANLANCGWLCAAERRALW